MPISYQNDPLNQNIFLLIEMKYLLYVYFAVGIAAVDY